MTAQAAKCSSLSRLVRYVTMIRPATEPRNTATQEVSVPRIPATETHRVNGTQVSVSRIPVTDRHTVLMERY